MKAAFEQALILAVIARSKSDSLKAVRLAETLAAQLDVETVNEVLLKLEQRIERGDTFGA